MFVYDSADRNEGWIGIFIGCDLLQVVCALIYSAEDIESGDWSIDQCFRIGID